MSTEAVRDGVCPECGSTETLTAGRIPTHNALVMTGRGLRRSTTPCPGGEGKPAELRPGRPAMSPCGTRAAKRRHRERKESCARCGVTYQPPKRAECGTRAGYDAHRRRGEHCEPCRLASNSYHAAWKAQTPRRAYLKVAA